MSKLTLDEAIKHYLEVAEENEELSSKFDEWDDWEKADADNCRECAADHRQLAEWLTELKQWRRVYGVCPSYEMCIPECREGYNAQIAEYKRLLKAAVNDMKDVADNGSCNHCIFNSMYAQGSCCMDGCYKWRYADEALKLIES